MRRREFLTSSIGTAACVGCGVGSKAPEEAGQGAVRTIDFHQHTTYLGRTDDELVAHQRKMGAHLTVLLPAGSMYGLAAEVSRNDSALALAERFPSEFVWFANELPDIDQTRPVLERYLALGARGIGEQKFPVACDSPAMQLVYSIARDFDVPVLMHFQHEAYNFGIERFHTMLEQFPTVDFIGHAQTWWGNVDADHEQAVMYPKTPVAPGGITDRLLADYPNMYGDLSANSGLNSMLRDEDHARGFLERHQDRLVWASDCNDTIGEGPDCIGAKGLAAVRRLAPDEGALRKILGGNAARLLKLA